MKFKTQTAMPLVEITFFAFCIWSLKAEELKSILSIFWFKTFFLRMYFVTGKNRSTCIRGEAHKTTAFTWIVLLDFFRWMNLLNDMQSIDYTKILCIGLHMGFSGKTKIFPGTVLNIAWTSILNSWCMRIGPRLIHVQQFRNSGMGEAPTFWHFEVKNIDER